MLTSENQSGARNFALTLGILFTFMGIAGFIPAFVSGGPYVPSNAEGTSIYTSGYGLLFGLFPINFVHNVVHLLVGLLGIGAYSSVGTSRVYCQFFAISYAGIALLGLLPLAKTMFGLMPIFGNNVWFNALTAALAGYFGFIKPAIQIGTGTPTTSSQT